jgi:hypothetical protein
LPDFIAAYAQKPFEVSGGQQNRMQVTSAPGSENLGSSVANFCLSLLAQKANLHLPPRKSVIVNGAAAETCESGDRRHPLLPRGPLIPSPSPARGEGRIEVRVDAETGD